MKRFFRILNLMFYLLMLLILTAAISSTITNKPQFLTSIKSNSMYPLFQRGDIVFIKKLAHENAVKAGDVIVFKPREGSYVSQGWIMHRVISGSPSEGFITKGDANERTDQALGGAGLVKPGDIAGRAIFIGSTPIVLPLAGYIPLWAEKYKTNPYTLPAVAVVLAVIIFASEFKPGAGRHKKSRLELPIIYFASGIILALIIGASMLATSQYINLTYDVSDSGPGILMGSPVGILKVGDTTSRPLAELKNKGFFPVVVTITSDDGNLDFSHDMAYLKPGEEINTTLTITGKNVGEYRSGIWIGMHFPFLPKNLLYKLSKTSYWLALAVSSLVPAVPVILYPLLNSKMRRRSAKEIRRGLRRLMSILPI